jgi:hypothetical protein
VRREGDEGVQDQACGSERGMKRVEPGGRETGAAEGQAKELRSSTDKARQRAQLDIGECVRFGDAIAQNRDEGYECKSEKSN